MTLFRSANSMINGVDESSLCCCVALLEYQIMLSLAQATNQTCRARYGSLYSLSWWSMITNALARVFFRWSLLPNSSRVLWDRVGGAEQRHLHPNHDKLSISTPQVLADLQVYNQASNKTDISSLKLSLRYFTRKVLRFFKLPLQYFNVSSESQPLAQSCPYSVRLVSTSPERIRAVDDITSTHFSLVYDLSQ